MNRVEKAVKLHNQGYNCAQSVFCAFIDKTNMDINTALKLTQPLGTGIARLKEVCGAFNGMTLMLGLCMGTANIEDKETKKKLLDKVTELAEEFRVNNGSLVCKELLELNKNVNSNIRKKPCIEYVRQCAELLEKELCLQ